VLWAGTILWMLFWMNACNFMDGINGIAGRFGEIVFLSMMVIVAGKWPGQTVLLGALVGCCAGFLRWNHPHAVTFMGDCGSQWMGYVVGLWSLLLVNQSRYQWTDTQTGRSLADPACPMIAMIVLTLPFSWDVIYTLIRRALRGENLLKAHRSHLYQRLLVTGLSHAEVLAVCEKTFYLCALCAIAIARFTTPRDVEIRWIAIAIAFAGMAAYTMYVLRREGKAVG